MCCRYLSEKCSRTVGSCLDNQLHHLKLKDAERVSGGLQPLYSVSRYTQAGTHTLKFNFSSPTASQRVQLAFPVPQISSSLITLEVAADSLKFVQNAAPGEVRLPLGCKHTVVRPNASGSHCRCRIYTLASLMFGKLYILAHLLDYPSILSN